MRLRAGGRYYPKLLSAIPFTPATGRRLLTLDLEAEAALARGAQQIADHHEISWCINFLDQDAWSRLGNEGWLKENAQAVPLAKSRVRFFRRFSGRAL